MLSNVIGVVGVIGADKAQVKFSFIPILFY